MRWGPMVLAICLVASACLVAQGLAGASAPGPSLELSHGPVGDVTMAILRGPQGDPVLEARAGPAGQGWLRVAEEPRSNGPVEVTVVGDPTADDRVDLIIEAGGERWVVEVAPTPAETWQAAGAHRLVASPFSGPEANLTLAVGPVTLEGAGTVSPRFDLLARVSLEDPGGYTATGLTLDGQTVARLLSPDDGATRVHHARMHAWLWPAGEHTILGVRVERDLAPGLVHETLVGETSLLLDRQGPGPPSPTATDGTVAWPPTPEAAAYEAQLRNGSTPWRPVAVQGTSLHTNASLADGDQVRVRGIDAVGNPGPWSPSVAVASRQGPGDPPAPLPDRWDPLRPGATVRGLVEVPWPRQAPVVQARLLIDDPVTGTWQPVAQARESPLVWDTRVLPDGAYLLKLEVATQDGTTTRFFPGMTVDNLGPLGDTTVDRRPTPPPPGRLPVPDPISPLPVLATLVLLASAAGLGLALLRGRTGTAK